MTNSAYLVDGVRTPIGSLGGALAELRPDDVAAHVVRALVARHPALDPARVERDELLRPETTLDALAKLRPAFRTATILERV